MRYAFIAMFFFAVFSSSSSTHAMIISHPYVPADQMTREEWQSLLIKMHPPYGQNWFICAQNAVAYAKNCCQYYHNLVAQGKMELAKKMIKKRMKQLKKEQA